MTFASSRRGSPRVQSAAAGPGAARIDNFTHRIDPLRAADGRTPPRTGDRSPPFEREVQDRRGEWFLLRILPYRSGGSVTGVVLTMIHIEHLKRAEARARENGRQLTGILKNSPTLVAVKDTDGRYLLMNHSFRSLLRLSDDEVAGKSDYDLFNPDLAEQLMANDRKVVSQGVIVNAEKVLPNPGGPRTYLSVKFPSATSRAASAPSAW